MDQSLEATTVETAKELGLLPEEFDKIKEILGRTPNFNELSIYSVMWSEHCSYKNSIVWLKTLPKDGPHMLVKAGEENAGLVDIGEGLACAFKIESHNHPSALEPYQGAATGVGGINRDIFTMGARPIAQLNSLRFGKADSERTKWLLKGVTKGIGNYGNSFGIPTVGGEVYFDPCYEQNPLVNAFSAGILHTEKDKMISAKSGGPGNPVFIIGSYTGKDGIAGAAFASKDLTEASADDIPSVQVGDPFQEKKLLEATMELAQTGAIVGMQDMGAAGITCSTSEMSAAGGLGMVIHLDKVPTRQDDMKPWEILLSESQERMLAVIEKGREAEVLAIFDKWDLPCAQIGEVINEDRLSYYWHGELIAETPADPLVLGGGAPVYYREHKEPAYFKAYQEFDINDVQVPDDLQAVAKKLIGHPNIASKRYVYEQYDSMVGTVNMSTNRPSDAAVVNLKDTNRALAMTVDCNARYVHANPEAGAMIAVAEAARNIVVSGGIPSAITNCLNFGNPYNPEVYWQFVNAIKGMGKACEKFQTPVTGGNVSFYNQTVTKEKTEPVFPTPTIGMIGIIEDKKHITSLGFAQKGDLIYMIGENRNDISSSQYLVEIHGVQESSTPFFSLEEEFATQEQIKMLIRKGVLASAHDVSEGGLFVALMESAMAGNLGFDITSDSAIRRDAYLFGESQSRVIVSVNPDNEDAFIDLMMLNGVEFDLMGHVTKGSIRIDDTDWGHMEDYRKIYDNSLGDIMAS
ncbi:phosphoribosylformylglycinamidine synthase subunit PurL [Croceimicrobium hydrocarbonivorans]|uniref:Phosphoribosylformylglycinamidine synthase subunit PurL n=1 Tax=Croceimicrobium hydrocarbonivorans TaxID=2761580 RepID=A0A7H0VCM5_9FLAO|nr:phosphoribosylformylglycinamidine synthase subunit PurL [Croceimicrobium hydrocarbonivorans]QNR23473.1 phosphoribosylformylglycinamidine synthase subunit PurL [Croceimicrobium hydrocarbonivorans]